MTFPMPEPPNPDANADTGTSADVRFASYLADLAAHVDDPECGEVCREILNEDPQTQRAWFELSEAIAAGTASTLPLSYLVTAIAAVVGTLAVGTFLLRWVT